MQQTTHPAPLTARPADSSAPPKRVNLALQGGGAHGAFTWGVLDRLLEDGRLAFEGISGSSAGAMNAAVMAHGLLEGGAPRAREKLHDFWRRISDRQLLSPLNATPFERALYGYDLTWSFGYQVFDQITRLFSPYQFNPLDLNPLRDVLEETIDPALLRRAGSPKLFISATNVQTGRARVFRTHELSLDVLMASACLPFLFRAVRIDGEDFWDGGYLGNPALWPMFQACASSDIVLVAINPIGRAALPITAPDILNRLNEITFNSALVAEMRAIDFVQRLLDEGRVEKGRYKRLFMHLIEDEALMARHNVSSKFNADWGFLTELFEAGRARAEAWLHESFDQVGRAATVDLRDRYL
jgi:NTE family protein